MKRKISFVTLVILLAIFTTCGCGLIDKISNEVALNTIKDMPTSHYDEDGNEITFEEMLDIIFFKAKWKPYHDDLYSFDDDQDGKPDRKINYASAEEFTGKYKLDGETYMVSIIFASESDATDWTIASATINGEYLSSDDLDLLLEMLWYNETSEEE